MSKPQCGITLIIQTVFETVSLLTITHTCVQKHTHTHKTHRNAPFCRQKTLHSIYRQHLQVGLIKTPACNNVSIKIYSENSHFAYQSSDAQGRLQQGKPAQMLDTVQSNLNTSQAINCDARIKYTLERGSGSDQRINLVLHSTLRRNSLGDLVTSVNLSYLRHLL